MTSNQTSPLRVAVLVDLPRSPMSGGHVKCWERLALAAVGSPLPLDLTVYFSGTEKTENIGEHSRLRQLPPVFSTEKLKFLPYVPDHTDLSPYHPKLATELADYDVIHTTDGFFAFAKTAEKVGRKHGIPIVTSFHTDTPSYARIFTKQTIERLCKPERLKNILIEDLHLPEKQEQKMYKRLEKHVRRCSYALVTRKEDHMFADNIIGAEHVHHLRLGVDREMFGTHKKNRLGIECDYKIQPDSIVVLFVGRLDVGKNIYTLINATKKLLSEGVKLHVLTAGVGPAANDVRNILGKHASVLGFVSPDELARLYASVDVLALTSEVEIRSMAGVEAMASNCPVLVSKKSGVAELFNNTPAMQVIESGVEAWTTALREIAKNSELRNHMRKDAAVYCKNHLASWHDVLAEDLFSIWQKAI